jgi:hypothetical protein
MDKLEAVARAICISDGLDPDDTFMGLPVWNEWVPNARAALSAIPDARAAGVREGLEMAAKVAYVTCAQTRHVTLGDKVADAIRALKDSYPTPDAV